MTNPDKPAQEIKCTCHLSHPSYAGFIGNHSPMCPMNRDSKANNTMVDLLKQARIPAKERFTDEQIKAECLPYVEKWKQTTEFMLSSAKEKSAFLDCANLSAELADIKKLISKLQT